MEKLFILFNGPKLLALRLIYTPQAIERGVRFGLGLNKYGCNMAEVLETESGYSIILYKVSKPRFINGQLTAPVKKVSKRLDVTGDELESTIFSLFRVGE